MREVLALAYRGGRRDSLTHMVHVNFPSEALCDKDVPGPPVCLRRWNKAVTLVEGVDS